MPFSGDWGREPKAGEAADQVVSCAHAHHESARWMGLFPSRSSEEPPVGQSLGHARGQSKEVRVGASAAARAPGTADLVCFIFYSLS